MLPDREIEKIRKELDGCKNPLYFFHDDPDGLCSFLLLYRQIKEGYGIPVKATPIVDEKFLKKVEERQPDKIFVLDLAMVSQEFIDKVKVPIIWIDHHEPKEIEEGKVKYFNPRTHGEGANVPVCWICYKVVKRDLWIAMVGVTADWFLIEERKEFLRKYPDLLSKDIKNPEGALFDSKLGTLARIYSFVMMGKMSEVKKQIKVLTRIKDPHEILEQKTPAGRFVYRRYEKVNREYEKLLNRALKTGEKDGFVIFNYSHEKISFSKDLANELLHRFPDKIIVIGRERNEEIKMSLRSRKLNLPEILKNVLVGIDGYGGGHEHACGAVVKKHDYIRFVKNLKEACK